MDIITVKGITYATFKNGIVVCNVNNHYIHFNENGKRVEVPMSSIIIGHGIKEISVGEFLVQPVYTPTVDGYKAIQKIQDTFKNFHLNGKLMIVSSNVCARTYPGKLVAMIPLPGYERAKPTEKCANINKFATF